jgi:SAM-dependent methyltransferase
MNAPGVREAYEAAARLWAEGPGPVYARLADALVAAAGGELAGRRGLEGRRVLGAGTLAGGRGLEGRRVLDLGAGTGVAGRAALGAGAQSVVGADSALGMLRRCGAGVRAVAADVTALPFRDGCFDVALAAFCLGHLADPVAGLREARRVAAGLAASSFAAGWDHPA